MVIVVISSGEVVTVTLEKGLSVGAVLDNTSFTVPETPSFFISRFPVLEVEDVLPLSSLGSSFFVFRSSL